MPPTPFSRSIAVIVGINAYAEGIPRLETAVNDAGRLARILRDEHGYEVIALLDADASLERLTTVLTQELPSRVGRDDRVLFYFAGHGVALDGDNGPNGYLLPCDARRGEESTFLFMPRVHDALLALECRHLLVILDSCFSGAFKWSGTRDLGRSHEVVHQEKYDRFVRHAAWQVITSASSDQTALDQLTAGALGSRKGVDGHSPFALALFDALAGKGDLVPRDQGDGLVLATELYLYIAEQLQSAAIEVGHAQTPRLWPLRKHDKGEFLFFVPGRELSLPPAPPLTTESNPWRGLASYEASDAQLFFGRDAEITRLREHVAARAFTVVLGGSGTGKSSLVKAGLVPRLTGEGWHVLPSVRPGTSALDALARAVGASSTNEEAIDQAMRAMLDAQSTRDVLLVIDQVEELITLVRDPTERAVLFGLLARWAAAHARLHVVLTLRTDFEPNFDRSALGDRWPPGRFIVQPMSREQLREVVEGPATRRVMYFEPSSLVETLLDEVVATPGALPLLSFALSEMYLHYLTRRSDDRAMTREDYAALGGVVGALRARAESEHDALDEAHRVTLRRLMLRMVVAEGGTVAKRRVGDSELQFADPAEQGRARHVFQRLTDARLLVGGKEADGEAYVEPAHDALVRGWGRLLQWVREESDAVFSLEQRQRLTRAAAEWTRANRSHQSGLLWSDAARSAQLGALVRRPDHALNHRELEFARSSVRGRRRVRQVIAGAVVTLAAAGVWALISGRQASARARQVQLGSVVQSAAALAVEDPMKARLLLGSIDAASLEQADAAMRLGFLAAAVDLFVRPTVRSNFGELGQGPATLKLSLDGVRAVSDSDSTSVVPESAASRRYTVRTTAQGALELIPREATTGESKIVRVPGVRFTSGAVSPDDRWIAAISADDRVLLVSIDGRAPVALRGHTDTVFAIAWSPDSRRLATIGGDGARIWDPRARRNVAILSRPGETIVSASFSKAGDAVVTRSDYGYDAIVWRWPESEDRLSAGFPTILSGHADRLTRAHFTDDDAHVFTASLDGTARIWEPNAWVRSLSIDMFDASAEVNEQSRVNVVAFSPDGKRVALGTAGGTVAITTLTGDAEAHVLARDLSTQRALAFNPRGTELTALSLEGELRRWSIDAPDSSRVLHQAKLFVASATAAGDGRVVTTGDIGVDLGDPSIRNTTETWRWDLLEGGPPRRVSGTGIAGVVPAEALAGVTRCVADQEKARRDSSGADDALAFDPEAGVATLSADGTLLVSSGDGKLWLYDLRNSRCTRRELVTRSSDVTAVDVSRDGRRVLAAGSDGTVRVWDASNAKMLASFRPRGMRLSDARFSPDGTRILTLPAIDTVAYLWNADGSGAAAGFSGVGEIISGAWLSPDGRWLLTALVNGAAALWPLDEQVLLDDLRATDACLEATDRRRYLGEDERTATQRFESCRVRGARSNR